LLKARSSTLHLLRYEKPYRKEIFAFLRTVYSRSESDRRIHQWDWKYDANPFNRRAEPYILLLKDGDQIIGMEGAIPLRVSVGGEERWVTHSCDLVVHPGYRRQGLSRGIVGQYRADNPMDFGWLNELSHRAVAPGETGSSARLTPLVKPMDFDQLLQKVTGNRLLSRWGGLLATGARHLTRPLRRQPAPAGVTITQGATFDQRFDALWKRVCQDYPVMVVRDQPYLNWRFVCRPDAKYTLLMATRGPDLVGYLVLRVTERGGLRWGYLVDFLVESKSSSLLALLVEKAVESLRKQRVAIVSCLATAPFCRRTLYRQGFYPWHWGPHGYFGSQVDLSDSTLQGFRDARQWFLTMGDGDLEMAF
jgi:GNAT superfamily N-acetyltransferase